MRCLSPAKINLHLRVGPTRADGFHPLISWMVTVGFFDILDIRSDFSGAVTLTASAGTHDSLVLGAEDRDDAPTAPLGGERAAGVLDFACDETNLIVRAARAWQSAVAPLRGGKELPAADSAPPRGSRASSGTTATSTSGVWPPGVTVHLTKVIPTGGGLGGGSGNAATTLVALDRLHDSRLPRETMNPLAAALGSDVAFFLHQPSALCTGRGEIVTPTPAPIRARWAVLFLPEQRVSTPAAYRRFDQSPAPADWDDAGDFAAWATLPALDLLPKLINDLERPAFDLVPELAALRKRLEQALARPVRMSGSGSTLFTLYDEANDARQALDGMTDMRYVVVPVAPAIAYASLAAS